MAAAQAGELARRGHEVDLLTGWDGRASLDLPGVNVRMFRVKRVAPGGFSGLVAPGLLRYLMRRRREFDVVHVHLGRDLVSMPAALMTGWSKTSLILQTHGMLAPDRRLSVLAFDQLMTRRTLSYAKAILSLTPAERSGLESLAPDQTSVQEITNGVPDGPRTAVGPKNGGPPEVIFLSRLHPRKRVMVFAHAASLLLNRDVDAVFTVVGPDEGDLAALRRYIESKKLAGKLRYEGSIPPGTAMARLGLADVFVLPSYGEVVPMSVLEAMSVGIPTVITDSSGIADELSRRDASMVTDGSVEQVASAIEELLTDQARRAEIVAHGKTALQERYSLAAVVSQLERLYRT